MASDSTIRFVRDEDEARECVALMGSTEPWLTLGFDPIAALAGFMDGKRECYVVRDDAGLAGFVSVDMRGLVAGYIQLLCVRADRRGQGLGTQLIRWAEDRILKASPNVFICVSSFNGGARRLYDRLGFEPVGTLRQFVVGGHDEILLRKTRGPWSEFRPSVSLADGDRR
jgi:ribosomal-protein-alanine N-acetyltransferase